MTSNAPQNGNTTLPPIEVLRPGAFVSAEGRPVTFTRDDLIALAESYDPALFQAPHVIGHPRMNDPAFGLVSSLAVVGDRLVASSEEVEPAFADMVRARRFKDRSVQIYTATSPRNPTPGKPYLKHVGWLGAAAPAVKGLAPVASFADDDADCVTISLAERTDTEPRQKEPSMSEKKGDGPTAEQLASFAEREAKLRADEEAFNKRRLAAIHADHVSFVEALIKGDGRASNFKPADKEPVIALLDHLALDDTASFGEGDSAKPLVQVVKDLLTAQPRIVSFGEFDKDGGKGGDDDVASFAAPSGHDVDGGSLAIHTRALQLQASNSGLSYIDAAARAANEIRKGS